jgi:hypothetical protein
MKTVRFDLPLRLVNPTNARGHWAKGARRAKKQREAVALAWRCYARGIQLELPVTVWLTRTGPRVMDTDGNVAAFKHVRDQVAEQLGADDGDPRIAWNYGQAGGAYGVEVVVQERRP